MGKGNIRKMKFLVDRASSNRAKPFGRSAEEEYRYVDILWYTAPGNWESAVWQKEWRGTGTNHRKIEIDKPYKHEVNVRDLIKTGWFIEVASLEELGELIDECGESLVISKEQDVPDTLVMTIYDNYMD